MLKMTSDHKYISAAAHRLQHRRAFPSVLASAFRWIGTGILGFAFLGTFTAGALSGASADLVLPNDTPKPFDNFGSAVAVSGNNALVGKNGDNDQGLSAGAAYIFTRSSSAAPWQQVAKLVGVQGGNFDFLGGEVAIDGDVAAVAATGDDDVANASGAIYVYERNAGGPENWGPVGKLTAGDGGPNQGFGHAIDVSGNRIVIGAFFDDLEENFGAAYVFEREGDQWVQKARLEPVNPASLDNFGIAVAIDGDAVVVGADESDEINDLRDNPGAAYVFERSAGGAGAWGQTARLQANDKRANGRFGGGVGISGDTIAVGAKGQDGGASRSGAVYIFDRNSGGEWNQTAKVTHSGAEESDGLGEGLELSGNAFVAGAATAKSEQFDAAGVAFVFERKEGGQWTQVDRLNKPGPRANELFGLRIAFDGDTVLAGLIDTEASVVQEAASGAAFSYVVPVEPPPPPPPPDEDVFSGGDDLGGGWYESSWFGFYNTNFDPWIFHAEHGWTFADSSSTAEGMFLFDLGSSGWFFTGENLYPNLFSFNRNAWVFYFSGTSNPRNYVDLASGEFFDQQ